MSTISVPITITCLKCGNTKLTVEDENNDESLVSCGECGHRHGNYGDVKAAARDAVSSQAKDMFRNMLKSTFKGRKGWTLK